MLQLEVADPLALCLEDALVLKVGLRDDANGSTQLRAEKKFTFKYCGTTILNGAGYIFSLNEISSLVQLHTLL